MLDAKQYAHHLLDQLGADQLDAVVRLLEAMIHPDHDGELTEEDRQTVAASREYFRQNPEGAGCPLSRSSPSVASRWSRSEATRAISSPVKTIRFRPNVAAEVRAIVRRAALHILQCLHRCAETGEGDAKPLSGEFEGLLRLRVGNPQSAASVIVAKPTAKGLRGSGSAEE